MAVVELLAVVAVVDWNPIKMFATSKNGFFDWKMKMANVPPLDPGCREGCVPGVLVQWDAAF